MTLNASVALLLALSFDGQLYPTYSSWCCAALLALRHVNNRNGSVIPELAELGDGFHLSHEAFDTEMSAPVAAGLLLDYLYERRTDQQPAVVVGPGIPIWARRPGLAVCRSAY